MSFNFIWDVFNAICGLGKTMFQILYYDINGTPLYLYIGVGAVGVFVLTILIKLLK